MSDHEMTPTEEAYLCEAERRVGVEVREAVAKYYASAHEAFGVLLEEVEEFKAQVWLKRAHRDRRAMIGELVQVAAVAVKYAAQIMRELDARHERDQSIGAGDPG